MADVNLSADSVDPTQVAPPPPPAPAETAAPDPPSGGRALRSSSGSLPEPLRRSGPSTPGNAGGRPPARRPADADPAPAGDGDGDPAALARLGARQSLADGAAAAAAADAEDPPREAADERPEHAPADPARAARSRTAAPRLPSPTRAQAAPPRRGRPAGARGALSASSALGLRRRGPSPAPAPVTRRQRTAPDAWGRLGEDWGPLRAGGDDDEDPQWDSAWASPPEAARRTIDLAASPSLGPRRTDSAPAPAAAALGAHRADQPPPPPTVNPIGLFRAAREQPADGLTSVRAPTLKELNAITMEAIHLLFDPRRAAEITRPRGTQEDVKAAQFLKAQQTLETKGWGCSAMDVDFHGVFFGPQVTFRPGQAPATVALLMQWAVPFGLDTPGDISKTNEWAAILDSAASLYPQLEAEVFSCRHGGREFSMPASLFSKIRALAEAYFRLRAAALYPLLAKLGTSAVEEQAKTVVRGYIHQAVALPGTWTHIESMIDLGALRQHGTEPALAENAARVCIARAFLISLLQGQAPNWGLPDLVQAHTSHRPSATLLHATDFARLAMTMPAAASLAASLPPMMAPPPAYLPPGLLPSTAPPAAPALPFPALMPPAPTAAPLTAVEIQQGFRLGAQGVRVHPLYGSGEYAVPAGWTPPLLAPPLLPPPIGPPPPAAGRPPRVQQASTLSIPTSRQLVTVSSPFGNITPHPCDYCHAPGHAQYECPRRFADTYQRPLPGFTMRGDFDPAAWLHGELIPPARVALAGYLRELKIPPHRKFGVTVDHILSGTAPPPPP